MRGGRGIGRGRKGDREREEGGRGIGRGGDRERVGGG